MNTGTEHFMCNYGIDPSKASEYFFTTAFQEGCPVNSDS